MEKKVFISYSSKDQEKANQVVSFIESNGYRCFISSRDLVAGTEYAGQLIDNILDAETVVLLLSKTANESPHVLREVECAVSKGIPIIVYSLEEVSLSKSMGYYLMTHQWVPMEGNQNARLLDGLHNITDKKTISVTTDSANSEKTPAADLTVPAIPEKKTGRGIKVAAAAALVLLVVGIAVLAVKLINKPSQKNGDKTSPTVSADGTSSKQEGTTPIATVPVNLAEKEPGQSVTFGKYLEAPIEWVVLKKDENTYTLVSRYILCMKCFDAAEGGKYGTYDGIDYFSFANHIIDDPQRAILVRGNNDWSKSNLRTWLNSDKGVVKYEDQAPKYQAVYQSPYDTEAGFLNGFSEAEKNAMVQAVVKTNANCLCKEAKDGVVTTNDYVYLLSGEELALFETIDMHIYARPTEEAINDDRNKEGYQSFRSIYDTENYYYWLRDSNPEDYVNMAYAAATDLEPDSFYSGSVGACTYGVRPVITVNKSFFTE